MSSHDDDEHLKDAKIQRLRSFEIRPILPSSLQAESIELIEATVLRVTNKSLFSSLLRILPKLPVEFDHLKRVNGTDVLVKVGQNGADGSAIDNGERASIAELLGQEPTFSIRHIPRRKPMCRQQLDIYKKKWPMSFHKNAKLESMINGTLLTATECARIKQLFVIAERTKGALFYDPESGQVVAEGPSSVSSSSSFDSMANTDNTNPLSSHAVMSAIEQLSAKQITATTSKTKTEENSGEDGMDEGQATVSSQYLATGFYAILAMEPCTMCAMALVHVRVKRVFFGSLNAKFGALCSKWRLQESPHINHHFDVFQVVEKA